MPAIPGARPFQCRRHAPFRASRQKRRRIFLPGGLVKVCREKPARLIQQKRINANCLLSREMIEDDLIRNRKESSFGFSIGIKFSPITLAGGRVARLAITPYPSNCINIIASRNNPRKSFTFASVGECWVIVELATTEATTADGRVGGGEGLFGSPNCSRNRRFSSSNRAHSALAASN